jgi:elongation factor Ts
MGMELITQLREMTSAGIADCKKALDESGNDINKAVQWLREKGMA